ELQVVRRRKGAAVSQGRSARLLLRRLTLKGLARGCPSGGRSRLHGRQRHGGWSEGLEGGGAAGRQVVEELGARPPAASPERDPGLSLPSSPAPSRSTATPTERRSSEVAIELAHLPHHEDARHGVAGREGEGGGRREPARH